LQGTTLKAAGYNANGQLGQATGPTSNKTSFVTVDTDVDLVRIGGTDNVTVIYRKTGGTYYGLGRNTDGQFGQGASATTNSAPVTLVNLTTIIADNGGLTDLCLSGYNGKISVCVVCNNGQAFCAGNNTDGVLANGTTVASNTFQRVLWGRRDAMEKIVEVSSALTPSSGPAFTWRTNQGRVLQAGPADGGFATGFSPVDAYNLLVATPVQFGTL
jgi:alpha-tubulin suppressor-like RCC1 family protein